MGRAHYNLVRRSLEETGLHRGQPPLLFALGGQDGMTHSQLAAEMEVSPAAISNMVKRIEKAGFVVRRRDTEEERTTMRDFLNRVHDNLKQAVA